MTAPQRHEAPEVTVLISTRDRAKSLARTLRGLAEQELGGLSCEIIVVDNGSSDHTNSVLSAAAQSLPLVVLEEARPGKNRALNRALAEARGDLLVFTDDDVIPAPDWIQALASAAARWPQESIFGGAVAPRFPRGTPDWMTAPEFQHKRWAFSGYCPRSSEGPTAETPLGPNMAVRSRLLVGMRLDESMGPQGPSYPMGSEVQLLLRFRRRGEQFIFVPDARVEHVLTPSHVTKATLMARAYRCGRGNARLFPSVGTFPVLGIPMFHVRRAIAATLRLATSPFRSQRDRWIAAMEFHQVRGNITERITQRRVIGARGSGMTARRPPLFPTRHAVAAAIKRRGFWRLISGPLRGLLRPLVRIDGWHLFEADLDPEAVDQTVHGRWRIAVFSGGESGRAARVALCRLGLLGPEEIEDRLARGHTVAVAFVRGESIGYAWCAYSNVQVTELGRTLRVGPTFVVGYDGFVLHEWRGKRVLADLDAAQMAVAARAGRRRQLVYSDAGNRASRRALKAMGKRRVLTLYRLVTRLLPRDLEWTKGDASRSSPFAPAESSGRHTTAQRVGT